jgi:thymidine kinase
MISIIQGTMWSGKTTVLLNEIRKQEDRNRVIVIDCCNSRNTDRDLHVAIKGFEDPITVYQLRKDKWVDGAFKQYIRVFRPTLVVIDEFHLAQVFGKEKEILDIIELSNNFGSDIIIGGLKYDCFSNYSTFPIWDTLLARIVESKIEFNVSWLKSLLPCYLCGAIENVIYTKCLIDPNRLEDRVGDQYRNVCINCIDRKTSSVTQ